MVAQLEGPEDWARPIGTASALRGEPPQGVARTLEFDDLPVESLDSLIGKLPRPGAIVAGIQLEQFPDLAKSETGGLRLPDEAQAAHVFLVVATKPAFARWLTEKPLALVKADGLHPDAARRGELSDGEVRGLLTLYHGTDAI